MRESIFEAANDLLRAYSYSELTVKDICHVAGISKPTFYRYFPDKYAIAQWAVTRRVHQVIQREMGTHALEMVCKTFADQLFEDRDFYRKAYADQTTAGFMELNVRTIGEEFRNALYERRGISPDANLNFQIGYISTVIPHMMAQWISADDPLSTEEMTQRLMSIMPRDLKALLN